MPRRVQKGNTGGPLGTLKVVESTLLSTDADDNIVLDPSGSGSVVSNDDVRVTSGTSSTDTTTGSIITSGGIGVSGDLNVGGILNAGGLDALPIGTVTPATANFSNLVVNGVLTNTSTSETATPINSASGTVTHDYNTNNTFIHNSISGNFTANFTNIPTTDGTVITITLILNQGSTGYLCNAIQINGTGETLNYANSTTPIPTADRTEIQTFNLIRSGGSWTVTTGLITLGLVLDGSSPDKAAPSASYLLGTGITTSGVYWINWGGTAYEIYCDQSLEGGGWMMILNYVHAGGTNPSLLTRSSNFPRLNSFSTFGDESGSTGATGTWGHIGNSLANAYNWSEYMFYGRSNGHSRVIHFVGDNSNIVNYIKSGNGSMVPYYADAGTHRNGSLYNNATIPLYVNNDRSGFSNEGNEAMTNFPIYGESTIGNPRCHWGIRGLGDRWEVDDYPSQQGSSNSGRSTIHRIWVK